MTTEDIIILVKFIQRCREFGDFLKVYALVFTARSYA